MEKSIMQQDPSQAMLGWANGPELSNWMRLPSSHPKQPAIPKGTKSKILGPGEKYERIKYVYNMCIYIYTRRKRSQDRMSLAFKKFRLSKSPTPLFTGSSNHQPLQQLSGSLAWAAPDLATFLSYTLDETPWNWRQHMFQRMNPSLGVS